MRKDTSLIGRPKTHNAKVKALSLKQKRFVSEYMVDSNATQAAIRAGYSKNSAYSQGTALLKNPVICTELENQTQAIVDRNHIDFAWGLNTLKETLECDLYDFFNEDHEGFISVKTKSKLT